MPFPRSILAALAILGALAVALAAPVSATPLRVVDEKGEPVAGASLEAWAPAPASDPWSALAPALAEAETDEAGTAVLPLPRVDGLLILADHPRFAPRILRVPPFRPGEPLRLDPGLSWRGRVRFEGERLRAGRACASWSEELPGTGRDRRWRRCAEISPEGAFELVGLRDGAVSLTVAAVGFLPLERRLVPGEDAALELEPGILLRGRVVGPGEKPLPDAVVRRLREEADPGIRTDPEGAFTLAVPALPATLEAEAAGYRAVRKRVPRPPADAPEVPEVLVQLEPGVQVAGTLLGEQGLPLEKGSLWSQQLGAGSDRRFETYPLELADGDFVLDLPAPGTYALSARAEGYRPALLPRLELAKGQRAELGAIVLERGAGVRGTVVEAEGGEPLPGASVELVPHGTGLFESLLQGRLARTVSDAEGRFALLGAEAGRYELRIRRQGYAPAAERVDLDEDEDTDLGTVPLERGVELRGRVIGRDGEGRPGLVVRLFDPEQGALLPLAERASGEAGRFDGPSLAAGSYRVQVTAPAEGGERLLLAQEIEVPAGEPTHPVDLVVGGVHVSGVVTERGNPVAGGFLVLHSALDPGFHRGKLLLESRGSRAGAASYGVPDSTLTAEVGPDGTFELAEAPVGALWATFVGDDARTVTRQVIVPDQARARVVIEVGGVDLGGQVLDASVELGIEAEVRVVDPGGRELALVRSDAEGLFAVPDLEPGTYTVAASAPAFETAVVRGVEVSAEAPPVILALRPGEGGSLTVRLTRAGGAPVAGTLATLLAASGLSVASLPTDAYGTRRFEHLAPGTYFLVWADPLAGTGASEAIPVSGSEPTGYERALPAGTSVALACEPETCGGTAIEALAVFTPRGIEVGPFLSGVASAMRFSPAGTFSLGRLSPGAYRLHLWTRGAVWQKDFTAAGESLVLSLP